MHLLGAKHKNYSHEVRILSIDVVKWHSHLLSYSINLTTLLLAFWTTRWNCRRKWQGYSRGSVARQQEMCLSFLRNIFLCSILAAYCYLRWCFAVSFLVASDVLFINCTLCPNFQSKTLTKIYWQWKPIFSYRNKLNSHFCFTSNNA